MEELDINTDKIIEPDELDIQWVEQPSLFYKYSDALDAANTEKNNLKLEVEKQEKHLEKVKAEVELEIRNDPKAFDLEKATDASVKAAVIIDPRTQKSQDKLFALKKELNTAQDKVNKGFTWVNTISEKKISLSNLGGLLNQQYFSSPSIPRNLSMEYKKKKEKTQIMAKEKIKKRLRRKSDD